ncbi:helix-turn-helix domain-containing protein [Cloacibacillus porcorum]|uniref:helix-turn-helix domain-containing protein n=1 Tax=Cloacibacillus porcorum TaxID=1197717 RepID=UPI00248EC0EE|nr:helix-turn-helix domain-containing protein [Cloacibacillus porcorum]
MNDKYEDFRDDEMFEVERQDDVYFLQMSSEIQFDKILTPTDKAVYATLCCYCRGAFREHRVCYPSAEQIAEKTNCSVRTVRRSIDALKKRGALKINRTRQHDGRQGHNKFILMNKLPEIQSDKNGLKEENQSDKFVGQGDKNDPKTGPQSDKYVFPECQKGQGITISKELYKNNNNKTYMSDMPNESEEGQIFKPTKTPRKPKAVGAAYSAEFESFWQVYPHYNRRKSAAYAEWQRLVKQKVPPAVLVDAAVRYAGECRAQCIEKKYTLHASTFLGPKKEAWKDYTGPNIQMGREINDAIDVENFKLEGGRIDAIAYERARRGLGQKTQPGAGG